MQAIIALEEVPDTWIRGVRTPVGYIANLQGEDGGFVEDMNEGLRVWATAYAIPATLGMPWGDILVLVEPKEEIEGISSSSFVSIDGKDISAQVFIDPDAVVTVNGEWDGSLTLDPAQSVQDAIERVGDYDVAALGVRGLVEINIGENVELNFDRVVVVSIPVFSQSGSSLHVYSLSELDTEYQYEGTCVVENSICDATVDHLSQFVAVDRQLREVVQEPQVLEEELAAVYAEIAIVLAQVATELESISQKVAVLAEQERALAQATTPVPVTTEVTDKPVETDQVAVQVDEKDDANVLSGIDLSQTGTTDPELLAAGLGLDGITDQLPKDSSNGLVLGVFLGGFTIAWLFGLYLFIRFLQLRKARSVVPTIPEDILPQGGQN
jgi:hypothetical protein